MKKITIKSIQTKVTGGALEFTCTLMYGNLRTAICSKQADNHEVTVEFLTNSLEKLVVDHIKNTHSSCTAKSGTSDPLEVLRALILNQVEVDITTQKNDRLSEKKTLFRLKGDEPGVFRSTSEKYSSESCEKIQSKYSSRLDEIYVPSKHR